MSRKYKDFHFEKCDYKRVNSAYLPQKAYISLCQDSQAICTPCVKIGDTVKEGQIIAFDTKTGVNIHSSISGIVESFEEHSMPNGLKSSCIVIELKGSFTSTGKNIEYKKWKYDTSAKILSHLKLQGVINTLDNYNSCLTKQIESLNDENVSLGVVLFDFDKSSTISKNALKFYKELIFEGSVIVATAMKAKSIYFFCDTNEEEFLRESAITEILESVEYSFVHINSDKYPSASPNKLNTVLKKNKTTDEQLYKRIDIDITTCFSAYQAIALGLPITETLVEINGKSLNEKALFIAKIGVPIKKLLQECGGYAKIPAKIIANGLIKGKAIKDLNTPVTKYLKTITFLPSRELPNEKTTHCINCGLCHSVCPVKIHPDLLYSFKTQDLDISTNILLSAQLCDSCGLCNTTCPARLPLYQTISEIKEAQIER